MRSGKRIKALAHRGWSNGCFRQGARPEQKHFSKTGQVMDGEARAKARVCERVREAEFWCGKLRMPV